MSNLELRKKIEKWADFNLLWGTSCVKTRFKTPNELLDNLFNYLELYNY